MARKRSNPVDLARREARERALARVAEHTRMLNRHVTAVAELQAEAAELDRQAEEAAARIRDQAAAKREEILPHLATLLEMGHRPSDVELLCDVSRTQVKAARTSQKASSETGGAGRGGGADAPAVPAEGTVPGENVAERGAAVPASMGATVPSIVG